LAEATILGAGAPHRRLKPGELIPVRLRVQLYRSSIRTIKLQVRVPRGAHGRVRMLIRGAPSLTPGGEAAELTAEITIALGGFGPGPSSAPRSLADLKRQFAAIPSYDGVKVRVGAHSTSKRAYRDPALLITGDSEVMLNVAGGGRHHHARHKKS
jgi:hypothetical protein